MGHVDDFIRENISSKALGEKYRQAIKSGADVEAQNRIAEKLTF